MSGCQTVVWCYFPSAVIEFEYRRVVLRVSLVVHSVQSCRNVTTEDRMQEPPESDSFHGCISA